MASAAKLPKSTIRRDPRPRHIDGSAIWSRLLNADPAKHYVYVNKLDTEALAYYEFAGYEPVTLVKGGVRPAGGKTVQDGQHVEMRGMILYSIDRAEHARIEQEGVDGSSGQSEADRVESLIIDKRGYDPLRGMRQSFLSVFNETSAPQSEVVSNG